MTEMEEAEVCATCRLRETKLEGLPDARLDWQLQRAVELISLRDAGATFSYPDALTPPEWEAIAAYTRATRAAESEAAKEARDRWPTR